MESIFDKKAAILASEARDYERRMIGKVVRIGETFVYDRDKIHVELGTVIYPDQLRLEWDPPIAAIGSSILTLDADRRVIKVE